MKDKDHLQDFGERRKIWPHLLFEKIMRKFMTIVAGLLACSAFQARAQDVGNCSEALVLATYNKVSSSNFDWRLASIVTENEYNTIKHDAGANATIYGIPMGATYSDYQNNVKEKMSSWNESLTTSQTTNIQWTGLDPNSPNAYSKCLETQIFRQKGVHIGVKAATKDQVSVVVWWTPTGEGAAKPEWSWGGQGQKALPKSLPAGARTFVLSRPTKQEILAVNYRGYTDSLVIEPFPADPTKATVHYEETVEKYVSPEQSGWGSNWSAPYTLCTPDKPEGWTIVRVEDFHLESGSERGSCGSYTQCSGTNTDTPKRACRTTTIQGHNENRFDGYGKATSVLFVRWKFPVKN